MSGVLGQDNSAQQLVSRSQRPSFIADWISAAKQSGAKEVKRGVYRFADGSAITFTTGLPVEFIG